MLLLNGWFWNDGVFVHHFIITVYVGRYINRYDKYTQFIPQRFGHIYCCLNCTELQTKGDCFHCLLLIVVPIYWIHVDKYQYTCFDRPILLVTGVVWVHKTRDNHVVSPGFRNFGRKFLLSISIKAKPIVLLKPFCTYLWIARIKQEHYFLCWLRHPSICRTYSRWTSHDRDSYLGTTNVSRRTPMHLSSTSHINDTIIYW